VVTAFTLETLAATVAERASSTAERSYTKSLLEAGPARAAQKFGEEAVELVVAAALGETSAIISESADVLFHLLVLLRARGVEFADVIAELERRSGVSGHAEKAARKTPTSTDGSAPSA
jgi:phosphoribosyl-ATP pyrophosphohydrolase